MREIDKLISEHRLTREEYLTLLEQWQDPSAAEEIRAEALRLRKEVYGTDIYMRGLIEFTNICRQDCFYCGIRKSNPVPVRCRLKQDEILSCCEHGYQLGFRTFVLQGGEDGYFTDEILVPIVQEIKERFPDCALTLSIGERSFDSYERLREAGADRYLLRHETANEEHYRHLHPEDLSLRTRKNCLYDLKSLGYQVGAGFMVGSPYQTLECIADDLVFLQELEPEMCGIGPFIPHHDTRFADYPAGSLDLTLFLISLIRVMLPNILVPATTAIATLDPEGREKAMLAGANVLMPNISPSEVREQYTLYDNKVVAEDNIEQSIQELCDAMDNLGFHVVWDRGDYKPDPSHSSLPDASGEEGFDKESEKEKKQKDKDHKKKKKKKKKKKNKEKKEKEAKEAAEKSDREPREKSGSAAEKHRDSEKHKDPDKHKDPGKHKKDKGKEKEKKKEDKERKEA